MGRLLQIKNSFYAPRFIALETYGADPEPEPTLDDVLASARKALEWHRAAEIGFCVERDEAFSEGKLNKADELSRLRQEQRDEIERIEAIVAELTAPVAMAAE
jgi:hypothetical protein